MKSRSFVNLIALLLAASQLSCAVGSGLVPERQSMPVARASLQPEYRVFYDTLTDYGDWVLIEPYGYVFRPRATYDTWRPYGDGFWVPTDLYGWVWVSSEPYGWATYHYGQWFFDPYQGWVWLPGLDWAPSWVSWQTAGNYVGWAPLMPDSRNSDRIPGGAYSFVPTQFLGATDLKTRIVPQKQLAEAASSSPVENIDQHEGVNFNRGPALDWVERRGGTVKRVRIDDLIQPAPIPVPSTVQTEPVPTTPPRIEAMQRAGEKAAADAKIQTDKHKDPPPRIQQMRPFGVPGARGLQQREKKAAPRDSTR